MGEGRTKTGTTQYQQYDFRSSKQMIVRNCFFYVGGVAGLNKKAGIFLRMDRKFSCSTRKPTVKVKGKGNFIYTQ